MDGTHTPAPHAHRKAYVTAGILLLVLALCYSLFQVILRSPFVASWGEQYLSTLLRQPVSFQALELTFGTITVKGVHIRNPAGFPAGDLAAVRVLKVTPAWAEIVTGRKSFTKVALSGPSVNLLKDGKGEWNFAPLLRTLQGKKGDGKAPETIVRELKIEDGSLNINGRRMENISLAVADIATKGSATASLTMSADIPQGGSLRVSGNGRLGAEPSVRFVLEAPSLSLAAVPAPKTLKLADATGRIVVNADLHKGVVTGAVTAEVAGAGVMMQKHDLPVEGTFCTTFRYVPATDTAELTGTTLTVNRIVAIHGGARVEQLRTARRFTAELATAPLSIADVVAQLPESFRTDLIPSGRLLPLQLRIAGDGARGIAAAQGTVSLRDGRVDRRGKLILRDLAMDLRIAKNDGGWRLDGKLVQGNAGGDLPVRSIAASFSGRLNEKFRLAEFHAADVTAQVFGSTATGYASYKPSAATPFTASLNLPKMSFAEIDRLLRGKVQLSSGELSASADVAGRTPADFEGKIHLAMQNLSGRSGTSDFRIGGAVSSATVVGAGIVKIAGRAEIKDGSFAGKAAGGSFSYTFSRDLFSLEQGKLRFAGSELDFERIAGAVPKPAAASPDMTPVRFELGGLAYRKGPLEVRDMKGKVDAAFFRESGRKWLEGGATLAGAELLYRRETAGRVDVRLTVDEKTAEAKLAGTLLGGRLTADVLFDPYASSKEVSFTADLGQVEARTVSKLAAGAASLKAGAGTIDASVKGIFKPGDGVSGNASIRGAGLSIVAAGNKTIVSGAGFTVKGDAAGGTVTVKDGRVWVGPEATAAFSGEIVRAFAPERQGVIKVKIPTTPVTAFFDSFANVLPRPLQEATVGGSLSADSVLRLRGKEVQLDGDAALSGILLDIPAQKVSVTGVGGNVPFSLVLPVSRKRATREMQHPSRESYAGYLHFLQDSSHQGVPLVIEKVRFGPLELGRTVLRLEAGDGVIRINSFNSSLAEGVLVGRGYFGPGTEGYYGGDLLVGDLSLRAFCATVPAIKDYLSGKVDGIVSLAGTGKGVAGMTAFIDLWARGTKDEKMLVSKEFLQKLAGKNLRGIFFRKDRPYDRGEISGYLRDGYLTFETLDISHTNFFGVKDLSVSVAPVQNKISLDHLMTAIKEAAARGKGARKEGEAPPEAEFSWQE